MFKMAEIKIEKFEIMDVITTSGDEECGDDCLLHGLDCNDVVW